MKTMILTPLSRSVIKALALMAGALCFSAHAQTTWTNTAGDGLWNSAINWDYGVPTEFTPGTIGSGFVVSYDTPMAAANIQGLVLGGALSVNTNGFNIDPLGGAVTLSVLDGGFLTVNADGVITITNASAFRMMDRNSRMVLDGGTLRFQDNFGPITIGENGNVTATYLTIMPGQSPLTSPSSCAVATPAST